MKRRWVMGVLAAVALSAALVNAQFSQDFSQEFSNSSAGQAFLQAFSAIKSNYLTEVEDDVVIQGAIRGMLESLDDPFTNYITPEQAERSAQNRAGSFEGIGISIQARNRQTQTVVEVLNVYRDGPAWNAGVQRGDIIVEVDGDNVEAVNIDDIVTRIRGPRGTPIEVGFRRPGEDDTVRFTIERDTITIVPVQSTVINDSVGYLHIDTFAQRNVYEVMRQQLETLQASGITSLVLDLRNNGGGFLDQGILVADEFLNQGDIVFRRAQGVTTREGSASPEAFELPMVVLVNRNSASASEIVAGALQDNGRALVVGEPTFGKGVGQNVISLANGGELSFVTFEWLTPDRRSISDEGITPDVEAEDTRLPRVISISEGEGASAGDEIEIIVNGQSIGTTTADERGAFSFFQNAPSLEASDTQGEALIDLTTDGALRTALETLETVVAESAVSN